MPVQAPCRPVAEAQILVECQTAYDDVIVVDPPTRGNHDEHCDGIGPMHDSDGQRVQPPSDGGIPAPLRDHAAHCRGRVLGLRTA